MRARSPVLEQTSRRQTDQRCALSPPDLSIDPYRALSIVAIGEEGVHAISILQTGSMQQTNVEVLQTKDSQKGYK
ncbi:Hypothetical protein PMT_2578 [Prochlorococcus marinus str. MIT 9313]|uniref:Uncharacterized protein n=1 Tax=Prochlorococcus marinus (strain MIT 9313) TaxID=74547 RepID=B9ERJ8_PROMM|nr:Hypothetical protein PMT_2578 [Prochlorococcus marinus str. MIT 9313]